MGRVGTALVVKRGTCKHKTKVIFSCSFLFVDIWDWICCCCFRIIKNEPEIHEVVRPGDVCGIT